VARGGSAGMTRKPLIYGKFLMKLAACRGES
jgi:hypothetical protein